MPRVAKELTAVEVGRLISRGDKPAVHQVGGVAGLLLQCTPGGGRSWLLRYTIGPQRRMLGLGSYPEVSLKDARNRAREAKDKLREGIDPIADKQAIRAALIQSQRRKLTFAEAVGLYLSVKMDAHKSQKHRDQWASTLQNYAVPVMGQMPVEAVGSRDVLSVLEPIWQTKNETAARLRGRMEAVLEWAKVHGHRQGDNPARWAGNLKELLPAVPKSAVQNQPALTLEDAPRWFAALRRLDGMGSRALEFLTLTAARSGEVRGATWEEIDLASGVWIIPAARMKMEREHRVPLPTEAVALLASLPRFAGNPFVFPATRGGQLSDMTLSATMRRMHEADPVGFLDRVSKRPAVPHGQRSLFRDWAAEMTDYPGDMAEMALAHKVGNAVEASYRRGHMVEKRRSMMQAWTGFLQNTPR